ncbi:hypothetical protein ACIP6P_04615 [Streptomyces sp. NPDC088729]|uniref:hypothetical protein n=1 Tax=Streptomyces sp. NPDC088729 TaxID=3365876 RepID=UPI00381AD0E8
MTRRAFTTLLGDFGIWHERNSAAGTPQANLYAIMQARRTMRWLHPITWPGAGEAGDLITRRYKIKDAYLRRSLSDSQLATVHRHLTNPTGPPAGGFQLFGCGGQVNTVGPP